MFRNRVGLFWLKGFLAAFYALLLLLPVSGAADDRVYRPFDRIVVFGTSLSDPGNAYLLLSAQGLPASSSPPYTALIPDAPYAVGGNRFSNGPTWIEQLAGPIGLAWSVKPAFLASVEGSSNYAVGGTRANEYKQNEVLLSQQVMRFLQDGGPQEASRELYVIEMGGNDVRDALEGNGAAIPLAIDGVKTAIETLYGEGARKFLVWNVPNLGRAPAIIALDAFMHATQGLPEGAVIEGAKLASQSYNFGLAQLLAGLAVDPNMQHIDIVQFDTYTTLETIARSPERFRLRDVTHPCIVLGAVPPAPTQCSNPDRFLFWDGVHPTKAGHAILAIENGKALIADLLAAH